MSKKPEPWHLWVLGIYTVIVLWYLSWTGITGARDWCVFVPAVSEANCASWVQALGSIVTIAAAAAGLWWQVRRQEKAHFEATQAEEVRRLQTIWLLIDDCARALDLIWIRAKTMPWDRRNPLRDAIEALRAIPPFDMLDARIFMVVRHAVLTHDELFAWLESMPEGQPYERQVHLALRDLLSCRESVRQRLSERGADIPKDPNIV